MFKEKLNEKIDGLDLDNSIMCSILKMKLKTLINEFEEKNLIEFIENLKNNLEEVLMYGNKK